MQFSSLVCDVYVPLFVWVGITFLPLYSLASVLCTCISMYIILVWCIFMYVCYIIVSSKANCTSGILLHVCIDAMHMWNCLSKRFIPSRK